MATCRPFQDISAGKPLFQAVYATILIGILFSTLFIISSLYSASAGDTDKPFYSFGSWLSSTYSRSASPQPAYVDNPLNKSTTIAKELGFAATEGENLLTRPIWDLPPLNSKMPDVKAFRLSKKMVEYRAIDNVIIVTFGNYAFMDFILNWVKHLTDLNVFNLLVGAMDIKLLEALYRKGVPVFDMGSNMNTIDVGWGSPTFHKMGREKVFLINALLPYGYELLMCDTDMVWLKNPLQYLARFPEADILTSSNQVIPTVTGDRLEVWQQVSGAYNIGIFHWRPTYSAQKLAKEWLMKKYGTRMDLMTLFTKLLGHQLKVKMASFMLLMAILSWGYCRQAYSVVVSHILSKQCTSSLEWSLMQCILLFSMQELKESAIDYVKPWFFMMNWDIMTHQVLYKRHTKREKI